jgi:hypothetical protein
LEEFPTTARAEERDGVLLRRSPVLREFSQAFLEWVENQSTLKQKSKDYHANGWRLPADTDIAGVRLTQFPKTTPTSSPLIGFRKLVSKKKPEI